MIGEDCSSHPPTLIDVEKAHRHWGGASPLPDNEGDTVREKLTVHATFHLQCKPKKAGPSCSAVFINVTHCKEVAEAYVDKAAGISVPGEPHRVAAHDTPHGCRVCVCFCCTYPIPLYTTLRREPELKRHFI